MRLIYRHRGVISFGFHVQATPGCFSQRSITCPEGFAELKIVTTLGPATDRDNNLEKVIAAGANVVRMNFSHGSPEDHKMRADKVRGDCRKRVLCAIGLCPAEILEIHL